MIRRSPDFVVFKGKDGQWYLSLRGLNGQKVLTSEGYTRASTARKSGDTVMGRFGTHDIVWHPEDKDTWHGRIK